MTNLTEAKSILEARLDELLGEAREIDAELRESLDPDADERAIELEDDEVLEGLGNAALAEIAQIRKALIRIKVGTYGKCTECGNQIKEPRLAAVPHASKCIDCAN